MSESIDNIIALVDSITVEDAASLGFPEGSHPRDMIAPSIVAPQPCRIPFSRITKDEEDEGEYYIVPTPEYVEKMMLKVFGGYPAGRGGPLLREKFPDRYTVDLGDHIPTEKIGVHSNVVEHLASDFARYTSDDASNRVERRIVMYMANAGAKIPHHIFVLIKRLTGGEQASMYRFMCDYYPIPSCEILNNRAVDRIMTGACLGYLRWVVDTRKTLGRQRLDEAMAEVYKLYDDISSSSTTVDK